MLQAGDRAPNFKLASDSAGDVSSSTLAGARYVLFCYPKDDTPGCTAEACGFRDRRAEFAALRVAVFGVSADPIAAHERFARKFQLNFPLLADPEHLLLEPLGVWIEKNMYGRKYFGVQRATFVVGADGRIEQAWPKVKVPRHVEAVLDFVAGKTE